jgi:hypothetical protein
MEWWEASDGSFLLLALKLQKCTLKPQKADFPWSYRILNLRALACVYACCKGMAFWWYWGLKSGHQTCKHLYLLSHSTSPFYSGYFGNGGGWFSQSICPRLALNPDPPNLSLLNSWITGMSYLAPGFFFLFLKGSHIFLYNPQASLNLGLPLETSYSSLHILEIFSRNRKTLKYFFNHIYI